MNQVKHLSPDLIGKEVYIPSGWDFVSGRKTITKINNHELIDLCKITVRNEYGHEETFNARFILEQGGL